MTTTTIKINDKFGTLTVIGVLPEKKHKQRYYTCMCTCGRQLEIGYSNLRVVKSCGCKRYKDITGRVFGKLTVIRFDHLHPKSRQAIWLCRCACGVEKLFKSNGILCGDTATCGCGRRRGFPEISGKFWWSVLYNAKLRDIKVKVTREEAWKLFIAQDQKCALSGLPLIMSKTTSGIKDQTASLDRVDSSKGYVLGNLQWVHKRINVMKNKFSAGEFVYFCKAVAAYQTS